LIVLNGRRIAGEKLFLQRPVQPSFARLPQFEVQRHARSHESQLLRRRRRLIQGLPIGLRHSIDRLARLIAIHRSVRGFADSVGQAVAAEAGQPHQVDVLDIGARPQMFDETTKGGGGETVVQGWHGDWLSKRDGRTRLQPRRAAGNRRRIALGPLSLDQRQ